MFATRVILIAIGLAAGLAIATPASARDSTSGGDAMAQRLEACTACHAEEGIRLEDGYVPRIHGKPAGYLYNQLVNYQTLRRRNATMNHLVSHLSRDYLYEIARHFAERHPPYPAAAERPGRALAERGEQLVREGDPQAEVPACASCHGERLTGVQPNTPGLVGLPRQYIMAQLGAWQVGTRHAAAPDCMAEITARLDGRDVEAVAAWLAARPVPDNTEPADAPVAEPPMDCGSVPAPDDNA
ncbi:c-type cytochrome [Salinisphaera orenii]|uniref:Cytochrome C n=1 Tax=Salinisphaera orenii YIM 95161 TaxID=1051139 RepID=A0A423Q6D5_9GAMM|nr:c-type cytochrome [Salinisphaera halophila]ROO35200.1 cytochrome C [Salinisphaera halophila YIM 95161]